MQSADSQLVSTHPMTAILNMALWITNHVLAAIIMIDEPHMKLIQLLFTCGGITITNGVIVVVNWKAIKQFFRERKNKDG